MTESETRERVKKLILERTAVPEEDFRFDMLLREELLLESFLLVNLLCELEDMFRTEIPDDAFPYIFTPEDLVDLVKENHEKDG